LGKRTHRRARRGRRDSLAVFSAFSYYATGPATGYRQRVIRETGQTSEVSQDFGSLATITTEYTYDAVGNVTSVTDGRSIRTDYVVNALNQVVKITRAATAPSDTSYALRFTLYDDDDVKREDVKRNSTPLDYETLYWYDANNNLVRVDVENVRPDLDADFHPTGSHSRDAANPWWTTTYTYDLLDNLVRSSREVSPASQAITGYRYDPLERLTSLTFPMGNRVEYAYDARNRLSEIIRGVGTTEVVTTKYDYDANGNLIRVADGEGRPTDTVYDGFDRRAGQVDALGNVRTWRYDANGNVVETTFGDGQDGRNPGRTLNAAGLVTLSRVQFSYDERSRRYRQEQRFFTADVATGVLTPITTDSDGDGWVEAAYAYDRNGNVTALTDDRGDYPQSHADGHTNAHADQYSDAHVHTHANSDADPYTYTDPCACICR